jgi:polyhydroxybutyrate depolymerase
VLTGTGMQPCRRPVVRDCELTTGAVPGRQKWSRVTVPDRRRRAARRGPLTLALVAVALVLAGCGSAGTGNAPAGQPAAAVEAKTVSLRVDGRDRSYLLEPATGLKKGEKAALVVVLHQEGGTAQGVADETELASLREQGASLVYPSGIDHSWDAGGCCGLPRRQGVDDVEFLDALLTDVAKRTPVDAERRALVGYSSGGMLTYRYVCKRPGTLAAAVVVSGSLESPCDEQLTVPDVLAVHGKKDGTIGIDKSTFIEALGLAPRPAASTLQALTTSAGCDEPVTTQDADAEIRRWEGCRGGVIEARLVEGVGHGWVKLGASRSTQEFLRSRLLAG